MNHFCTPVKLKVRSQIIVGHRLSIKQQIAGGRAQVMGRQNPGLEGWSGPEEREKGGDLKAC